MDIHPNMVKRPQRVRKTLVGKYAYYFPVGIAKNELVKEGSKVKIIAIENNNGKDLSFIKVYTGTEETSVLLSDLAFVHKG